MRFCEFGDVSGGRMTMSERVRRLVVAGREDGPSKTAGSIRDFAVGAVLSSEIGGGVRVLFSCRSGGDFAALVERRKGGGETIGRC